MTNAELKELVHLLMMCGIMDKTTLESGNITDEEWQRMNQLIDKYQSEKAEPEVQGDLISREALKKELNFVYSCAYIESKSKEGIASDIIDVIDNAPTVEEVSVIEFKEPLPPVKAHKIIRALNKRPQGEWIENTDKLGLSYICPFCGHEITGIPQDLNYCCKCGAKMKGGTE